MPLSNASVISSGSVDQRGGSEYNNSRLEFKRGWMKSPVLPFTGRNSASNGRSPGDTRDEQRRRYRCDHEAQISEAVPTTTPPIDRLTAM